MIGFLIGIVLATIYWFVLVLWGVFLQAVAAETWAGWRARVSDILWFIASALSLGFLIGWEGAVVMAQVGGVMSTLAIVVQALTLWREGERQSSLLQ